MSLAPQELENSASKFAAEAIKLDSQGARGMAIANYQRAIESLVKLIQLYPENKLNRVYQERTAAYQNRIKALQMNNVELEPAVDPKATPEEQKQSLAVEERYRVHRCHWDQCQYRAAGRGCGQVLDYKTRYRDDRRGARVPGRKRLCRGVRASAPVPRSASEFDLGRCGQRDLS